MTCNCKIIIMHSWYVKHRNNRHCLS